MTSDGECTEHLGWPITYHSEYRTWEVTSADGRCHYGSCGEARRAIEELTAGRPPADGVDPIRYVAWRRRGRAGPRPSAPWQGRGKPPVTGASDLPAPDDSQLAPEIEAARAAAPIDRIEHRDTIAAFGPPALAAIAPWFGDPQLAGFAVRVAGAVGTRGWAGEARAALGRARSVAPTPAVVRDIDRLLSELGDDRTGRPGDFVRPSERSVSERPSIPDRGGPPTSPARSAPDDRQGRQTPRTAWTEAVPLVSRPTLGDFGGLHVWTGRTTFDQWPHDEESHHELNCRKGRSLLRGADGSMSCAEIEVARAFRAAGWHAGWLATCGRRNERWRDYMYAVVDPASSVLPHRVPLLPPEVARVLASNGTSGYPDVVAWQSEKHPAFVELKGPGDRGTAQARWLERALASRSIVLEDFLLLSWGFGAG